MNILDKYNCIFCKYKKYNKNHDYGCMDIREKDEYGYPIGECNSLSNIYYGKLINYFPFKQIDNFLTERAYKKEEQYTEEMDKKYGDYALETDEVKFIWGVKLYDDLSDSPCNLLTMNDFDVTYLKDEKKYILGVETIYQFDKEYDGEKAYLKDILDKFTEWMKENGYDTERKIRIWQFGDIGLNSHFDSIEDAYAAFKYMVKGF